MAEQEDDRDSVDRAFADLVAGYHLTADHPAGPHLEHLGSERSASDATPPEEATGSAETAVLPLPLPLRVQPVPVPRFVVPPAPTEPFVPAADERYVPDPLPPLSRPGAPALVGWTGVLFAAVVVLAAGFGVGLPAWLGWLAVTCFIVGSVVLLTQLPRHRPPGSGDGAVV